MASLLKRNVLLILLIQFKNNTNNPYQKTFVKTRYFVVVNLVHTNGSK